MEKFDLKQLNPKIANYHTIVIDLDCIDIQINTSIFELNNNKENIFELSKYRLSELTTSLEKSIKAIEELIKKAISSLEIETLEKYKEILMLAKEQNGFLTRFQKGVWDPHLEKILPRVRIKLEFLTEKEKSNFIAKLKEM